MEIKNYVTNVALGCCLSVSPSFSSSYDIPLESHKYLKSSSSLASKYIGNTLNNGIDTSNIIDINKLESIELISLIERKLNLSIDDYFIPNKDSHEKITLFITCKEFKKYCENQQYDEALKLETKITSLLENTLLRNLRIARVAFL